VVPFTNLTILTKNNLRKTSDRLRSEKNCRKAGKASIEGRRECRQASRTFDSIRKCIGKLGSVAGPIGRLRGLGGSLEEAREVEDKCRDMGD
jgi:hypothetical protein